MPNRRDEAEAERAREAAALLDRVNRDAETVGASSLVRVAEATRDHFAARDASDSDPIELWGRRIGRALALILVAVLLFQLVATYLLP
ncbi:MAG: hypothetical protein JNM13_06485 [Hyphomicrobiaceae bacterium]|nr:hypothetical protein [Hyphomicrobiaceae bacterium]